MKEPKASKYTLNEDEIRRIIDSTSNRLERIIIKLLAFTGCRRAELVLLRFKDIDLENNLIHMPTVKQEPKGENEEPKTKAQRQSLSYEHARMIPILNKDLKDNLSDYMDILKEKRPITSASRLLQTRETESITETRINQIVAEVSKRAGVKPKNPKRKNVHPHLFRHSFVRWARKMGVDYKVIQEILGHSSITTTFDLYGEPSLQDTVEELQKMKGFASGDI